jgi:dinuclear metal center YbgI/SA1388 family protein
MKIGGIYDFLDSIAPFENAMSTDNCGLLVGSFDFDVKRALVVLDITNEIIDEAAAKGAELIISHHPVIYTPLRSLTDPSPAFRAAQKNISVICAHTNFDAAPGGVNDLLISALEIEKTGTVEGTEGCVALALCPEKYSSPLALARHVKQKTGASAVRLLDGGRPVKKLAVCCGGGASFFEFVVKSGADAFVTGDLKYPQAVDAKRLKITLVDVGHYETEIAFVGLLIGLLSKEFPQVEFIRAEAEKPLFEYIK